MEQSRQVPIWFFIGILLFVYGLLITGVGIYHLIVPPANPMAMSELHPDLWWGCLLLVLGSGYCLKFRPRSRPANKPADTGAARNRQG